MKKIKILIVFFVMIAVLSNVAIGIEGSRPIRQPNNFKRYKVERLLKEVARKYKYFNLPGFMEIVSENYTPDRMRLLNRIGDSTYTNYILSLDFFVNKVIKENNTIAVSFRWQKKTQARGTSNITLTEGKATFIFKREKGILKLYQIKGENPLV